METQHNEENIQPKDENSAPEEEEDEEEPDEPSPSTSRTTRSRSAGSVAPPTRGNKAAARRSSTVNAARRSIMRARPRQTKNRPILRRSLRSTRSSQKIEAEEKAAVEEKKKREMELKALVERMSELVLQHTASCIYEEVLYRIGDIIGILGEDMHTYYAKIVSFWSNKYCEKHVAIRWLVPIHKMSHPIWKTVEEFEPMLFREASHNDKLIRMEDVKFVKRIPIILEEHQEPYLFFINDRVVNVDVDPNTLTSI